MVQLQRIDDMERFAGLIDEGDQRVHRFSKSRLLIPESVKPLRSLELGYGKYTVAYEISNQYLELELNDGRKILTEVSELHVPGLLAASHMGFQSELKRINQLIQRNELWKSYSTAPLPAGTGGYETEFTGSGGYPESIGFGAQGSSYQGGESGYGESDYGMGASQSLRLGIYHFLPLAESSVSMEMGMSGGGIGGMVESYGGLGSSYGGMPMGGSSENGQLHFQVLPELEGQEHEEVLVKDSRGLRLLSLMKRIGLDEYPVWGEVELSERIDINKLISDPQQPLLVHMQLSDNEKETLFTTRILAAPLPAVQNKSLTLFAVTKDALLQAIKKLQKVDPQNPPRIQLEVLEE